ncbi:MULTISPECIES: SurA N-terminal domain-containing protein [unclassified Apibacter]|uniref:peptidylprolyl isomerase n=1 Tax=unclassified Apibacter TaxID=2630820 RepID=UPI00132813AE|nr:MULTISPECIES: SurA N-terminal domain-containing protein [unclassified Apibacter]MCX8677689.1 SurA N-terminal domain-containing protein [Apibacter sp. B3919]MXO24965.1 peptidylprolyl isomerase [Apibacter sp. B3924]MXO27284.1 peptidylprolyl isomerase [Apibacter sp. B3813]MXO29097.1 peptidylprolyl isomerase [Apibacter sp. B3913]MXO31122.1 peptidylprolyl isomerase [Apibacter sp. B3912]
MAILGQIRKRNGLLIGFVAVALLLFLLGGIDWSRIGKKDPNVLGKVNKEAISRQEYYSQLSLLSSQYQGQYPENLLEGQIWNSLIEQKLIEQKFNASGLILTDKMIWNMAKSSPLFNNPQFKDKSGNINTKLIQDEFQKMEESQNASPQYREYFQTMMTLKKNFGYQAMGKQYLGTYGSGMLTNNKEIELLAQNQSNIADIEYVKIDYNAYQKSNPVKVTDEDLKAYIERHKSLFKIDENRTLDFVYFSAKPTPSDENNTLHSLNALLSQSIIEGDTIQAFGSVKNDSLYISELNTAQIADKPFISQYRSEKQLPQNIQNWVKNASIGQISNAYKDNGYYVLSKLIAKKNTDSVTAKNILISYTGAQQIQPKTARNKDQAKKQADELAAKLNANPSDFAKLASQYSDDPTASSNNGEMKLTTAQDFPAPYKKLQRFLETSPTNKAEVIETPQGYLVLMISQRKPDEIVYKLADLAKEIKPSEETIETARKQSTNFIQSIQGKSSREFIDFAKKSNYKPQQQRGIVRFGSMLNGLHTDKDSDIIAWAFDSKRKLGDTEVFTTGDQSYIVARVSSLFSKGLADPSLVRDEIETEVRNEKLGKIIAEKVNSGNKSLDNLATEFKTTKSNASISFDNPSVNGEFEPKVGGAAFGLKQGVTSKAIEGKSGVYIIVTKSITKGQVGDKKQLKTSLMSQYAQQMPSLLLRSLVQESDITDYRGILLNQQQK